MSRVICSFSCGAASAVATKLAINMFDNVEIVNVEIAEEHEDNRRFLHDCEKWFGRKITVLRDKKYDASIVNLFLARNFIIGPGRYPCTTELKKFVLRDYYRPTDEVVIGFTADESHRADRYIDANNDRIAHFPLIDRNLSKSDCLALIQKTGIELPYMYRTGYRNANCIGCVKGGQAYWNKIKTDFPEQFERMAQVEEQIGASILRVRSGPNKGARMPLRELKPTKRKINQEPDISCSVHCELMEWHK